MVTHPLKQAEKHSNNHIKRIIKSSERILTLSALEKLIFSNVFLALSVWDPRLAQRQQGILRLLVRLLSDYSGNRGY